MSRILTRLLLSVGLLVGCHPVSAQPFTLNDPVYSANRPASGAAVTAPGIKQSLGTGSIANVSSLTQAITISGNNPTLVVMANWYGSESLTSLQCNGVNMTVDFSTNYFGT